MTTAYVTHPRYVEHNIPGHPEHAGRIEAVWAHLEDAGLHSRLTSIVPEPVTEELMLSVHTPRYLEQLAWTAAQKGTVRLDPDTYTLPVSYEIARLSAGGVVRAIDEVLSGRATNGLAAVPAIY